MRLSLLVLALFSLTACSQSGDASNREATAETPEPAVLGGVDLNQPLRAIGTEPFWGVDFSPRNITYTAVDAAPLVASNPGPTIQGTTAVYASAGADGTTLVVTLMATECSDGMSDRVYPLTAKVEVGPTTLKGCAASVAFLQSQPAP